MKLALVLLLACVGAATAARELRTYDLLEEHEPLYNVLNVTGWDDYPSCWLFPTMAVTLVKGDKVYQVATLLNKKDSSAGRRVADAWCQRWGFDAAGDFEAYIRGQHDWPDSYPLHSISIASGKKCLAKEGKTSKCTAFRFIECVKEEAKAGCSKALEQVGGLNDNRGYMNEGTGNVGNFNNGSTNLGDYNTGSANVGYMIEGSASVGAGLKCSACKAPLQPMDA